MPVHFGQGASFTRDVDRSSRHISFASAVEIIGTSVRDTTSPEFVVNREVCIEDLEAEDIFAAELDVAAPASVVEIVVDSPKEEEETASRVGSTLIGQDGTTANVPTNTEATDISSLQRPLRFPPRNSSLRWRAGPQPLARRSNDPTPATQQNVPLNPPPGYSSPQFQGDNDDEIESFLLANPVPGYLDDVPPPRYDVHDPREYDLDIILEDLFDDFAEWTRRRREAVVDAWNALTYNSPRWPGQLRQGEGR